MNRYYGRGTKSLLEACVMDEASGSSSGKGSENKCAQNSKRNFRKFRHRDGGQKIPLEEQVNCFSNSSDSSCRQTKQVKSISSDNRKWWYTNFGKGYLGHPSHGLDFTVMSYNILAQTLLENHPYLYYHCKKEYLTWEYRSQNLLQEIDRHKPDIICLQEVQEDHYNETFRPFLNPLGYFGLYKKRTGENYDGCAIFFATRLFKLESRYNVEFRNSNVNILDRDNVGLIVVLKPRSPKFKHLKLVCATTHLLFNPRRGDIKLAQLRFLLAEIEKVARKKVHTVNDRQYHPVIFCGDLNSEPFFPLYSFIVRGVIKYDQICAGNVSGQDEGFNKGAVLTENTQTLALLGIGPDTCYESLGSNAAKENLCSSSKNGHNSTGHVSATRQENKRGYFSHPLNFSSTYRHVNQKRAREVTTGHSKSMVTADYIFYNVKRNSGGQQVRYVEEEGDLRHIGCYGLLHVPEVKQLIPNSDLSSDHFCLISRFLLSCS